MAVELHPYQPDLEKIARQSETHEPLMLSEREYRTLLSEHNWTPGAKLTRDSILKAMELGVIRIWNSEINGNGSGGYNVLKNVGPIAADFTLGPESWHYDEGNVPSLILGEHEQVIHDNKLLKYAYRCPKQVMWFQVNGLVLALTQETLALSNAIMGNFDGRSKFARIGGSNHQTAGSFEPGWIGQLMMEISNVNKMPIGVKVLDGIASMSFELLNEVCTVPRNLDQARLWTIGQSSPFGVREPEWDEARSRIIAACMKNGNADHKHYLEAA